MKKRKKIIGSSGGGGAVILDELVVEILSWLPVKDLMRFRCVSKSWNSLVFHPTLVKYHLQRSSRDTHILFAINDLFRDEPWFLQSCSADGLFEDPSCVINVGYDSGVPFKMNYRVIGVCNGLICLRHMSHEFQVAWVQFWNPATRLMSKNSPPILSSYGDVKMGFGYDESSDTYKVVAAIRDKKSYKIKLSVHCLGDNYWRKVTSNAEIPANILEVKGQYLNGTLNWVAQSNNIHEPYVIFSFDIRSETYTYLSLPIRVQFGSPELGILKGCLCLYHNDNDSDLVIWQMKEFGVENSWTMFLKVSYENFELRRNYIPHPLCISPNGDVMLLGNSSKYQVVLCNMRNNSIRHMQIPLKRVWFISFDYVQSLVLPYRN